MTAVVQLADFMLDFELVDVANLGGGSSLIPVLALHDTIVHTFSDILVNCALVGVLITILVQNVDVILVVEEVLRAAHR